MNGNFGVEKQKSPTKLTLFSVQVTTELGTTLNDYFTPMAITISTDWKSNLIPNFFFFNSYRNYRIIYILRWWKSIIYNIM